jgi:hypothetical protein
MAPKAKDISLFFYITIFFSILISILGLKFNVSGIKENWAVNRCNPIYMPLADDVESNFVYCVQTSLINLSPFLLEPLHALTQMMASIASSNMFSIDALRISSSNFRGIMTSHFSGILDAITEIGISFQNNAMVLQDVIGKIVGIAFSIMYIVESTIDTFESTWNGPPGQILRQIGNIGSMCFHPDTLVELELLDIEIPIKCCQKGDVLKGGSVVEKVLRFYNVFQTSFFEVGNTLVTGNHKIFSEVYQDYVHVKEHEDANLSKIKTDMLICLVTSDHKIRIRQHEYLDWEDD